MNDLNHKANRITAIVVFCGSNFGVSPAYREAAQALGVEIAKRGWHLIYGGTDKGLMGIVADAVIKGGGRASGVITKALQERGHQHPGLASCEVVSDMRARKARMIELGDAFVALPGGYGTLEELLEVATLAQLGIQAKPFGMLDVNDFYSALTAFFQHATAEGFMKREHAEMLVSDTSATRLFDSLLAWELPQVTKWIGQAGA